MVLNLSLLVNSQLLLKFFTRLIPKVISRLGEILKEEEIEVVEEEEMTDHKPLVNSKSLLPSFLETESQKRRGLKESDLHQLGQELQPSSQVEISKSAVDPISDSGVRRWTRIKTNQSGSLKV